MKRELALKQLEKLKKHLKNLRLAAEGWNAPWQSLISIMLSARTRDEVTIEVCNELFEKYRTAKELSKANLEEIQKIIRPVNYYKTKSKNVLECAKILSKKYDGNPPVDFEKLIELPGVGRKTANVFLSEMGKDAIGVDTHVSQLAQKLKWTKNTKPEKIEEDLKKLFPQTKWIEINETLVLFGRSHRGKKQDELLRKIS
jgi:endonuclease III